MPYLWPGRHVEGWAEMRVRVLIAMVFLVAAKVAIVYVPILFKEAVDALTKSPENLAIAVPIGVLVAYGLARVLSVAFGELRDAVFAKVAHRAIRTVALQVFRHLHNSLRSAITSTGAPAASPARSSAARRASSSCSPSCSSTSSRR